ncbi:DUF2321 domain-containing protein [Rhodanobacter sp. Soil772]|uniref:DUF2321 domain-containing protein n=1 Tax=Rhodanobacter sp. Soil772 TaxID=1736406 RepID=UPI0009E7E6A9|nr:DUF2321 domain-containing protein [Rhodanobacter sp. Soil772]
MSDSYYDTAQICLNGHVVSTFASSQPQSSQKFCAKCGAETIMGCAGCNTAIRGYYHVPGVIGFFEYSKPAYCYGCGKPFPWTAASLEAASELVDDLPTLSHEEKQQLKESFPDLVRDTPRTAVAEGRFKRLTKKAGTEAVGAMRSILIDVVSEAVKKSIFGP